MLWALLLTPASSAFGQPLPEGGFEARLADEDPEQRRLAIHAIADQGGPRAIELLAGRLEQESDDRMRRAIHDALLRVPLEADQLGTLLAESEIVAARAYAAHALGRSRGSGSTTRLLAAIRDPSPEVRREVYEALGAIGDRTVMQELIKAAVRESSPSLREAAEQSAQRLAEESGRPRDVMVAISMLRGGNLDDRLWAVEVLAESGDWRAMQALLDTAQGASAELRHEAIKGLGVLGDHRAVPALLTMLATSSGRTRHYVIGALALLRDESSLEALGGLVEDPDPAARVLAIRALSALDHPGVAPLLLPALDDVEEAVRVEAIHALGRCGGPEATEGLLGSMNDPSPFLRAESVRLLSDRGGATVEAALIERLEDRDPLVRLTAAEGLAMLGAEAAVPSLERRVDQTRDDEERAAYEQALQRLRGSPPQE